MAAVLQADDRFPGLWLGSFVWSSWIFQTWPLRTVVPRTRPARRDGVVKQGGLSRRQLETKLDKCDLLLAPWDVLTVHRQGLAPRYWGRVRASKHYGPEGRMRGYPLLPSTHIIVCCVARQDRCCLYLTIYACTWRQTSHGRVGGKNDAVARRSSGGIGIQPHKQKASIRAREEGTGNDRRGCRIFCGMASEARQQEGKRGSANGWDRVERAGGRVRARGVEGGWLGETT